jgi:hypothetical protein
MTAATGATGTGGWVAAHRIAGAAAGGGDDGELFAQVRATAFRAVWLGGSVVNEQFRLLAAILAGVIK